MSAAGERPQGIAVVGMACRFPGAPDLESFWEGLLAGREGIARLTAAELRAAGVPAETLAQPGYVGAKGVVADTDRFDAAFFGLSPREAELLDPQHRLLLECSWHALEHAGHDPRRYAGPIGVFAGAGTNTYLLFNLLPAREALAAAGAYQAMLASDDHFLATRVSYKLGLRGPSLTVQTACSSSLVAVHLAVQSLLYGECDMALAGGVRVSVPQRSGHVFQPGGIFSPDGRCRPFDAAAAGSVDGDGVGVVVLKRLDDALADGDRVHAVLLGSAVNNDGSVKVGYTAPSVEGQAEVVALALAVADVDPATVGYVEAHGTATPLGDPIEVAALNRAFAAAARPRSCALGSVKGNLGHLDAAAGIASLIKAALAVERGQIPPTLHFERPNPQLDLDAGPFFVNARPIAWPAGLSPRRAGVSSFGIGGTNAHAVLEEPPLAPAGSLSRPRQLLVLSAASSASLEAATAALAGHLDRHPELGLLDLADVAYTLQVGRGTFAHRRALVCGGAAEGAAALRSLDPRRVLTRVQEPVNRPVAFLFPGQGAQHPGMGEELYRSEPTFRHEIDRAAERLLPSLGTDLREALFAPPMDEAAETDEAAERLNQTALAQPALFAVEHALARLWMEWGVRPEAMLGHSVGEYVAACLAGVFPFEDALLLVAERGRLMQEMPAGAMLSVALPEAELKPLLGAGLALAAVNTPALAVASGGEVEIAALAARLAERGVQARRLHTSHAFHSPAMEPAAERFRAAFAGVRLTPPEIPFVSSLTGDWIRPEEATDPAYWVRQLVECVRFSDGLAALFARADRALLEVGPGRSLAALARRHPARPAGQRVLASLPSPGQGADGEVSSILQALGELWLAGVEVDWQGFHAHERRLRVPLPAYPFERRRHWVEPPAPGEGAGEGAAAPAGDRVAAALWAPLWRQTLPIGAPAWAEDGGWLVFAAEGFGERLAARLAETGHRVVVARPGERFRRTAPGEFELRPGEPEDYQALLAEAGPVARIAHLWSVVEGGDPASLQELGFESLMALARALAERGIADPLHRPLHLGVVSAGMQRVAGEASLSPVKATLLGPAAVLPQEIPGLTCQAIDVEPPAAGSRLERELVDRLLAELAAAPSDPVVAYRAANRWVRSFAPLSLAPGSAELALRGGGTYLITGGLGGVGMALAELLAGAGAARLVLLGRSPFPPRPDWPALAARGGDAASAKARRLLALEARGAEILLLEADVADRQAMRRALGEARRRFGPIHGAIHAAGVAGGGLAERRPAEEARAVLSPKVFGTLVLTELLADDSGDDLDFLVLCSSLNAILGGPGQADYAAANAFLGAFAEASAAAGRHRVVAIDWDAWRGVGMAAGAAPGAGPGRAEPELEPSGEAYVHPLLGGRGASAPEEEVAAAFASRLGAGATWVLDEHRLGGTPVLPGTAFLEMAGAAFRAMQEPAGPEPAGFELRDVVFLAPFAVADGETRELATVLRREEGGFRFAVRGRTPEGEWQEHAVGAVSALGEEPAPRRDLDRLLAGRREEVLGDGYREGLRRAGLGARWEGLRRVWVGADGTDGEEGVVGLLELAPELAADVEAFYLHPALLDAATGFAEAWLAREEGDYLPLSYRRLEVRGPLPRRFYSHARRRLDGRQVGGPAETLAFDISILDEEGRERMRVEELTLKRADAARAIREGARARPAADARSQPERDEGMAPADALEAFRRILAGPHLPRVAVSARPLPEAIARARLATVERLAEEAGAAAARERPDLSTPYRAPRGEIEERIAAIYESVLGVERAGADDDFFELGGHSLLGTQLLVRIRRDLGVELPLARLFEAPTVAALALLVAAELQGVGPLAPDAVPKAARGGDLPLSFAQERLWFFDRLEPGNPFYNVAQAARLDGRLEIGVLAGSLGAIVVRHEVLRTAFAEVDGVAVQRVLAPAEAPLPRLAVVDLQALAPARGEAEAERLAARAAATRFDLARPPLLACELYRLAPDRHLLALVMHHAVSDGWSVGVFLGELAAGYRAALGAALAGGGLEGVALPPLPVQYGDYAVWQRERLRGPELAAQLAAWRERLAGPPPALDLPTDRPRPPVRSFLGASELRTLPPALTAAWKALCRGESATLFMGLLAAWAVLLERHTGQRDLWIGSPVAGRDRRELEGLIGVFLNTLVLRADLSGGPSLRQAIRRLRAVVLDAYSRQEVPFEKLVEELRPERDPSRTPLFDVLFNMQDFPPRDLTLPGLRLTGVPIAEVPARFDLTLHAAEVDGAVRLELEHSAELFDRATAARWLARLETLLAAAVAAPEAAAAPLGELPLLPAAEREEILARGGVRAAFPVASSLAELFAEQVRRAPDAVAVTADNASVPDNAGEEQVTYGELARQAARLAAELRGLGVGLEVPVALRLDRGAALVAAILGVLAAGGAYVPLDPALPEERLSFVLADSGARLVVSGAAAPLPPLPAGVRAVRLEESPAGEGAAAAAPAGTVAESLAYVLYTSGSTGRPKGVAVTHGNVLRLLAAAIPRLDLGPGEVWTLFHSYAFDFSVWEMWGALAHGGRLVVVPYLASRDPAALADLLAREQVTVLNQTPSAFAPLAAREEEGPVGPALRAVVFGGEALEAAVLAPWVTRRGTERPRLWNLYGITETTVHATVAEIALARWPAGRSPIGEPLPDLAARVVDRAGRLCPIGVPGELQVAGAGLARGYLGRPELTAERFTPDPWSAALGERLYRSGDLARWRPGGGLEYLGRIDHQVKVRGVRIELEEVEAVLGEHPAVAGCALAVRGEGADRRLVAYWAARAEVSPAELRAWLRRRLPEPMLPAAWMRLDALPLTATGKVDRRALPAGGPAAAAAAPFAPPATATERRLAEIWQELLDLPRVGRDDRFFDLGGHSLLALRAAARLRAAFHLEVPVPLLFTAPTLAELAAWVDGELLARADRAELAALLAEIEQTPEPEAEAAASALP